MFGGEIRYAETANPFSIKAQAEHFMAGLVRQVQAAVVAEQESVLRGVLRAAFQAGEEYGIDQYASESGAYVPNFSPDFDAWLDGWIKEHAA